MNTVGEAVAKARRPSRRSAIRGTRRGRASPDSIAGAAATRRWCELNKRLVIITPNAANPRQPGTASSRSATAASAIRRRPAAAPSARSSRFVEENGRVIRMNTGDSYVERVR